MKKNSFKQLAIIVPCFNEAAGLSNLLNKIISAVPGACIIVVDDGSSDDTSCVAKEYDTVLLRLPFNCGIGVAVQTGMIYAYENGFSHCIQIDGDGQHDPRFIEVLLK